MQALIKPPSIKILMSQLRFEPFASLTQAKIVPAAAKFLGFDLYRIVYVDWYIDSVYITGLISIVCGVIGSICRESYWKVRNAYAWRNWENHEHVNQNIDVSAQIRTLCLLNESLKCSRCSQIARFRFISDCLCRLIGLISILCGAYQLAPFAAIRRGKLEVATIMSKIGPERTVCCDPLPLV